MKTNLELSPEQAIILGIATVIAFAATLKSKGSARETADYSIEVAHRICDVVLEDE